MNINKLNPYIRHARYSILKAGRVLATRSILDYELVYVEEGRLLLKYNSKDYIFTQGDFLLLHPGVEHSFHVLEEDLSQPHIHFDLIYDDLSDTRQICYKSKLKMTANELRMIGQDILIREEKSPLLHIQAYEHFKTLFFSLIDEYVEKGNRSAFSLRYKMMQLIEIILNEQFPNSFQVPENRSTDFEMEMIKYYIDANALSDISLHILETQFHYSRSFITQHFKACYGISVMKYCNQKRMETAYELLKKRSVTEVSEMMAFSTVYSFSRAFKNTFGFPPSDVQKQDFAKK